MELLIRTVVVSLGASGLAAWLAMGPALLTLFGTPRTNRWIGAVIGSFVFLPSYVVAGAWSAGFGTQGWWTLSQVTAARFPSYALASVVWIQAMSVFPLVYWMLRLGLEQRDDAALTTAMLEGGFVRQFRLAIRPSFQSWFFGTVLLTAAWVGGDMVVTNLFQVSTLTEACYLGMIGGTSKGALFIASGAFGLGLGWLGSLLLIRRMEIAYRIRPATERRYDFKRVSSLLLAGWSWLVVLITVLLPLINLVVKAGWTATQNAAGEIHRSWSGVKVATELASAPRVFSQELGWSLILSLSASISALVATAVLIRTGKWFRSRLNTVARQIGRPAFQAVLIAGFALPGPLVSSMVIAVFQWPFEPLRWLNDNTLAAPILCLQFRLIPIAYLMVGWMRRRWHARHLDLAMLDAGLSWRKKLRIGAASFSGPLVAMLFVLFAFGFGELSTYILCLPPGVTPVSMRIFDLLHYGVRAGEAGLLLFLVAVGGIVGIVISRRFRPG